MGCARKPCMTYRFGRPKSLYRIWRSFDKLIKSKIRNMDDPVRKLNILGQPISFALMLHYFCINEEYYEKWLINMNLRKYLQSCETRCNSAPTAYWSVSWRLWIRLKKKNKVSSINSRICEILPGWNLVTSTQLNIQIFMNYLALIAATTVEQQAGCHWSGIKMAPTRSDLSRYLSSLTHLLTRSQHAFWNCENFLR